MLGTSMFCPSVAMDEAIDTDVSILGCGWLGRPLGRRLVDHDATVRGSTDLTVGAAGIVIER